MTSPPFGDDDLEVVILPLGFDPGGFSCREPELCDYLLDGDAARDHQDARFGGRGVGDFVLNYVVGLGRSLAHQIGLRYVTLDALDRPTLIARYEKFGFVRNVAPSVSEDGEPSKEVSMRFDLRE